MGTISDFKVLDNLSGYDKAANPNKLNVFDLLPYGGVWSCNGKVNEIRSNDKVIPLLLKDNNGIALIKSPFSRSDNNAYIVSPLNKIEWDVGGIIRRDDKNVIFSDVYYIFNDLLFFFVNFNGHDYRFSFDPKIGEVGRLIPSY